MQQIRKFGLKVLFPLLGINLIVFLFIILKSTKLRPISDDYCFAAVAGQGTVGALAEWYSNWTGDLFGILVSTVLLGLPIILLPWSLSSAIPFITSGLAIGSFFYFVLNQSLVSKVKYRILFFFLLPVLVANTWWSQWWITPRLNITDTTLTLPNTITFWQTINTGYVISLILILCLVFYLEYSNRKLSLVTSFFCGVTIGFSGLVYALSILVLCVILIIFRLFKSNNQPVIYYKNYLIFLVTSLIFMSLSFNSPGTQSRKLVLESNPQIENINVISLVSWTFPEAIFTWIGSILNLGSLVSFFTFSSLGFISSKIIKIEFRWKHRNLVPLLFLLSIIMAVISRVSEAFSYPAFWHWVPIYLLNFLVVIFISFYFGVRLSQKFPGFSFFVMAITITCIVQIIQIYSIYFMTVRIDMRYEMWSKGSAPLYQIADLYFPPTKGYTDQCWERIGEYRLLPKRDN
jgi:hypothetical protein